MSRSLAMLALTVLALVACGGSDRMTGPSDACAQALSDAYVTYGTPTNRVELNDTETDLYWGHTKREYIRHSDRACFVSDPIAV